MSQSQRSHSISLPSTSFLQLSRGFSAKAMMNFVKTRIDFTPSTQPIIIHSLLILSLIEFVHTVSNLFSARHIALSLWKSPFLVAALQNYFPLPRFPVLLDFCCCPWQWQFLLIYKMAARKCENDSFGAA